MEDLNSAPSSTSMKYTAPFSIIGQDVFVKALEVKNGKVSFIRTIGPFNQIH